MGLQIEVNTDGHEGTYDYGDREYSLECAHSHVRSKDCKSQQQCDKGQLFHLLDLRLSILSR